MCCFGCLICMCFLYLYLHLFSAIEHVVRMKRRSRNTLIIITIMLIIIIIIIIIIIVRMDPLPSLHAISLAQMECEHCYQPYLLFVGCLTPKQRAQRRICSDKFTCCQNEVEAADQTVYFTQSQYANTNPSADLLTAGAWQGSHRSANF